jgi:hypothetical protein
MTLDYDPVPSNVISYSLGVTVSFALNRHFTFRMSRYNLTMRDQFVRFYALNLLSLAISTGFVYLFSRRTPLKAPLRPSGTAPSGQKAACRTRRRLPWSVASQAARAQDFEYYLDVAYQVELNDQDTYKNQYYTISMQDFASSAGEVAAAATSAGLAWNAAVSGNYDDFYSWRDFAAQEPENALFYFNKARNDDPDASLAYAYFSDQIGQTADIYWETYGAVYYYLYCNGSC